MQRWITILVCVICAAAGTVQAAAVEPNAEAAEAARDLLGAAGIKAGSPYYVLHPGSGGQWKCWPSSCFRCWRRRWPCG